MHAGVRRAQDGADAWRARKARHRKRCNHLDTGEDSMSAKSSYSVTYTRKSNPGSMMYATRMASSVSEAKNMVKADEARRGEIVTIIACVKR